MNKSLKQVTISLPPRLFELGLTEAQVHGLTHRWLVISLYQQEKVTATEAGSLLSTDRAGFLDMLDALGILYEDTSEDEATALRMSPALVELGQTRQQLDGLIDELAQIRYELYKVNNQLLRADKVRSEFIATVSHELRTPLNSILGFAKLLLSQRVGPLNETQLTDLSLIYDSAIHLLALVNDILDLSKIEAGKIRLDMDWVTVEEIIVGTIATTYILIDDKPVDLHERIEPQLPRLYVDRERIRQVVINLLSNAAKFTDSGSITLDVHPLVENDQKYICFSVKDTGIGIARDEMEKVFEPFRQVDNSMGRRAEGTGLGIPISYRLVKLHGGKLWVESKIGQGSTFSFTIPVNPAKSVEADVRHLDYRLS
jgi:signal transduction histidine kinase